ncbi:glycosyl transferase [Chitinimonas prasina]|uniref:Glycosyl transferase n=1 Tax=Chitinimonas prasina TaxID=1434937 RepID=A0ABQ5YCR2_9NEIS|nr:glycosyltransferase family 1 protein [Chitinimonas prasina]GLR12579.1 glycosyl transferase [Chitinimonas prasina]
MDNRPLHLALITETFPPEVNGVAMTVGRMAHGLAARGHRVALVRPRQHHHEASGRDELLVSGLRVPRYPDLKFGLPATGQLLRRWRTDRPDLVVAVTEGPLGWSALRAARKLGIPAISEFHTNFHSYSAHYGMAWLERPVRGYLRRFHNRNLATLVPSEDVRKRLAEQGFCNLEVVARGVDTQLFDPSRRSADLRSKWGAGEQTQVVAYVGRMAAEKNLPLVLAAFRQMQAIRPDSKLLWVGDGPERAALQANHPEQCFAGMQRGVALADHYASADVFLFGSTTETYGNVTLEAMASGLGVISYDYAAARTHVRHHENGLLARFDDDADFVDQARYAASYPSVMRALGQAARQTTLPLGWEAIVHRFEDVARAALARAGAGAPS